MQDQTNIGEIAEQSTDQSGKRMPAGFVPLGEIDGSTHFDLDAVRERLKGTRGREYWRSLEEVADTPAFRQYLEKEFPHQAPRDMQPLNRRNFMQLMGATLALAGIGGCAYQPPEKIVPYLEQPESIVPGKPLFYATAYERGGYAIGLLGETHVGRPIKLEGNADHPASLGATDVFAQGSLLGLYDPDRSQAVRHLGGEGTWDNLQAALIEPLREIRRRQGAGLHVVIGASTSPTLASQIARFRKKYPAAKLYVHEPVSRENVYAGARLAFGAEQQPVYAFDRAARILSLDSDFLVDDPGSVRYAREFMARRRVRDGQKEMNRLYVVESTSTLTGANADHRLAVRPSQVEAVARAIAAAAGVSGAAAGTLPEGVSQEWVNAVAEDLTSHRGTSLVIAGPTQPPVVHALAHALNSALGNADKTVRYIPVPEIRLGPGSESLQALVQTMEQGASNQDPQIVVLAGVNPAYTAPGDIYFAKALETFSNAPNKLTIHLGLYDDETGSICQWHVPQSHYLESWSDARAYDGTVSIIQPLLVPLYASRTIHELFAALLEDGPATPYDLVRNYWRTQLTGGNFEAAWHQALTVGVVPKSTPPAAAARPVSASLPGPSAAPEGNGLEVVLRPDPSIWDGRFANNGWLQELPKPISTLTWDNAAYVSPATARQYNLKNNDLVTLQVNGRSIETAVWVVPGQPENTVSLTLGYGRTRAGKLGTKTGFNAYPLRSTATPWIVTGVQLSKTGKSYELAATQHHFVLGKERGLIKEASLAEYIEHPTFATVDPHAPAHVEGEAKLPDNLYPPMWPSDRINGGDHNAGTYSARKEFGRAYNDQPIPAWGMVIDLNACIGCNACTIACQAENNIATVGKDMVLMNREMHWIRVDQYQTGEADDPDRVFQPVPCMHCEKAPCEPVCPVEATSHSAEGINEMTYNRCIGTRYCSNNCPYKVRRFNFLQFSDQATPTIQMMRNPDVTVRSRGVMEKCTYCVQRVNWARMEAEKEDRAIHDGDVLSACQQVCPTEAIIFGNINDTYSHQGRGSKVRELKNNPLNYGILTELNTFPRTTYLARLRNPNPVIEPAAASGHGGGHGGGHDAGHDTSHGAGSGESHAPASGGGHEAAPGGTAGNAPGAGAAGHGAAPTQEGH